MQAQVNEFVLTFKTQPSVLSFLLLVFHVDTFVMHTVHLCSVGKSTRMHCGKTAPSDRAVVNMFTRPLKCSSCETLHKLHFIDCLSTAATL